MVNSKLNSSMDNIALIIVHMQNDYCDGGPLANINSLQIIPNINRLREKYNTVIFIKSFHPSNHSSFKKNGGKMPEHCIAGTKGAELNGDIIVEPDDIIVEVGTLQKYDTTSGFYDADEISKRSKLKTILQINGINELHFCGNSMDSFMFSTIMDAMGSQLKCSVILDSIGYDSWDKMGEKLAFMRSNGVELI